MKTLRFYMIVALALAAQLAFARGIHVATLNCYLCFKPGVEHVGQLDDKSFALTDEQYQTKVRHLLSMVDGAEFVALQEVGGRIEVEDLARAGRYEWAFAKGKDTYTGENVAALYRLPEWTVRVNGRVASLDRILSKHLLVTAVKGNEKVAFLVVHLIRPRPPNAEKHQRQLDAIRDWVQGELGAGNATAVVVLGDMNDSVVVEGATLFGPGQDAGELTGFAPTHLAGKPFDRISCFGRATVRDVTIGRPPYGRRPNDLQKSLWTDHFALKGTVDFAP